MEQDKLQKMFELTQKAQAMERVGNDDKALDYYLEIHRDYSPNTSQLFESPIRILEKKRRLLEAKEICERAIDLLSRNKITGNLKSFEDKLLRINRKLEEQGISQESQSSISRKSVLRMIVIVIIALAITGMLLFRQSQYDDLELNLEEQSGGIQKEGEGIDSSGEEEPSYIITDRMINIGVSEATLNLEVKDIAITVKDSTLAFGLIVDPTSSKEKIKEIVTNTLKVIGGAASADYAELKSPNAGSLGQIYDYYDIIVSVGESADKIILKGTKSTSKRFISWQQ